MQKPNKTVLQGFLSQLGSGLAWLAPYLNLGIFHKNFDLVKPNILWLFFLYTGMKSLEQQAGSIHNEFMDDPSDQQPV
jgi:hypothetical protein